jgi:thiamine biosynthesis protein ThiS
LGYRSQALYWVIVEINGEKREFGAALSIAEMLEELGIRPGRVVVELNRRVLPRELHDSTFLSEGDRVEIVHFVGGG